MKNFPWIFSLLWLVILVVMISAGFWQLRRADQKQLISENLSQKSFHKPEDMKDWQSLEAYQSIELTGHYHNLHFSLDNQIVNGQVGRFVFTAFKTQQGIWVMINRGWINGEENLDIYNELFRIKGLVADWPEPAIKLGQQEIKDQSSQVVTYLEKPAVNSLLKSRLCQQSDDINCIIQPFVIKLDPTEKHGFIRDWQAPRMTASKHRAYAAQWFTMSLVLIIVYGIFLRKSYANKNQK